MSGRSKSHPFHGRGGSLILPRNGALLGLGVGLCAAGVWPGSRDHRQGGFRRWAVHVAEPTHSPHHHGHGHFDREAFVTTETAGKRN